MQFQFNFNFQSSRGCCIARPQRSDRYAIETFSPLCDFIITACPTGHLSYCRDITDKLMKLQKNKKELTDDDVKKEITNNNVFVGSTTELQRLLLQKDDNIIDAKPED